MEKPPATATETATKKKPWFWVWVTASIVFRLVLIHFPRNLNLSSRPEVSTPLTSLRRRTLSPLILSLSLESIIYLLILCFFLSAHFDCCYFSCSVRRLLVKAVFNVSLRRFDFTLKFYIYIHDLKFINLWFIGFDRIYVSWFSFVTVSTWTFNSYQVPKLIFNQYYRSIIRNIYKCDINDCFAAAWWLVSCSNGYRII